MDCSTVVLIFGDFDGDLTALVSRHPTWIESTPGNGSAIVELRATETAATDMDVLTTFRTGDASKREVAARILEIDTHHGGDAADRCWQAIRVIGAPAAAIDVERLSIELGFPCRLEPCDDPDAFVVRRDSRCAERASNTSSS